MKSFLKQVLVAFCQSQAALSTLSPLNTNKSGKQSDEKGSWNWMRFVIQCLLNHTK